MQAKHFSALKLVPLSLLTLLYVSVLAVVSTAQADSPATEAIEETPGGIAIEYSGPPKAVAGHVTIRGFHGLGNLDVPLLEGREFKSTTLAALWWEPAIAHSYLVLGNSSNETVSADVVFGSASKRRIVLPPFATQLQPFLYHSKDTSTEGPNFVCANHTRRRGVPKSPLKRPVSVAAEETPLSNYLLTVFRGAVISGGIAIVNDGCEQASEKFPEFRGNVQDALEKLASTGHQLSWFQTGDGLVVHNGPSVPPLLRSVVREFQFSRKEPMNKASSALFDAPEVSDQLRALHLIVYGPELGFAQLPQPSTPQDIVTLTNTTVLDALNKIAGGRAVWLYKESNCERNVMSLSWPIR